MLQIQLSSPGIPVSPKVVDRQGHVRQLALLIDALSGLYVFTSQAEHALVLNESLYLPGEQALHVVQFAETHSKPGGHGSQYCDDHPRVVFSEILYPVGHDVRR